MDQFHSLISSLYSCPDELVRWRELHATLASCTQQRALAEAIAREKAARTETTLHKLRNDERLQSSAKLNGAVELGRENERSNSFDKCTDAAKVAKRRSDFMRETSRLYNDRYRMLSRRVYNFYIKRLKVARKLDSRLLLKKDMDILNKFELADCIGADGLAAERLIERGKERRQLVAVEEVFDVVHAFHEQIGHGKRVAIYDAIKREFANITLNCVLLYMAGCEGCFRAEGDQGTDARRSAQFNGKMRQLMAKRRACGSGSGRNRRTLVESAADVDIDYAAHFSIGQEWIHCRHCHFVYFHRERQRPKHSLRSHLRNYHRTLLRDCERMAIDT